MELKQIDQNLIKETSKFASKVFIDYYTPINGLDSATYMANKFLSIEAISQLIDKGAIFKVLINKNKIIGFTEYIKEDKRLFLSKLYLQKDNRGKGFMKIMFNDVLNYAYKNNLNSIYLTVNKHNINSYNIYLHLGFKVIDSVVTDIGQGYVMDDYIMELEIKK